MRAGRGGWGTPPVGEAGHGIPAGARRMREPHVVLEAREGRSACSGDCRQLPAQSRTRMPPRPDLSTVRKGPLNVHGHSASSWSTGQGTPPGAVPALSEEAPGLHPLRGRSVAASSPPNWPMPTRKPRFSPTGEPRRSRTRLVGRPAVTGLRAQPPDMRDRR
jgi:hypothetical protein